MLAVVSTHPIQYHAPVYRFLQQQLGIQVTAIYGSDLSVGGYEDIEFGEKFAWDTDLLSGYNHVFLSRVENRGATSLENIPATGLSDVLRHLSPMVVMMGGYGHRLHRRAFLVANRQRVPILFRAETNDDDRSRGLVKRFARDAVLRSVYQRCKKLLYIGEQSRRHYRRLGTPEDKLIFSPYCVDTSSFQTDERARSELRVPTRKSLGIAPDQKVVLFSGKLSERKGTDLLIEAIKRLQPDAREKITLVFVGNGDIKSALEEQALNPPAVNAIFPGFKNQTELSPFFHAADILVLPSRRSETWGLVVNEALHHGLPCVVSRAVGCSLDLIEPGVSGNTFATGSPESLALAIQKTLGLAEKAETRGRCQAKVAAYSVEAAARGIADAYSSLVPNSHYALA